jgi:hypothetical protein
VLRSYDAVVLGLSNRLVWRCLGKELLAHYGAASPPTSAVDALDEKSEALEEREKALTAADEVSRLADAVATAKAARKSD